MFLQLRFLSFNILSFDCGVINDPYISPRMSIWSSKTYIFIHSMCRDVDLVYWLLITLCQTPVMEREIGFVFFLLFLHRLSYGSLHLYAIGIVTDKQVPFSLPFLQSPRFYFSVLLNLSLSSTSHAVSVLLWNLFILFFFTRCLSVWQCTRNRHKAMCSVRHLIILRQRERERVGGIWGTVVLQVWTADHTQIQ